MKGRITKTGYRRNSPDVNNDFNIIPSNRISMRGVDFPVFGVDNMGNSQMMYPGGEYEFQGDYVTELPAYGSGGLTQWFAEKWVDIKTGKKCGRSGKDKKGRPYPACRPSKRVNSTTPKTTKEMSASEKAKFKRKKKSGKRIDYNHKRAQLGGGLDPEMLYRNRYNTELTPSEKKEFDKWVAKESKRQGRDILMDMGAYDVQGFWKSGDHKRMDQDNHGTDTWKKPNHPTFSNQSKYHGADGFYGGNWKEDGAYQPSKQTLEMYGSDYYDWMFGLEPNRPEHLDTSRYNSGANKPTPFYYQRGGDVFQEVDTYIKPGQNIRPNWAQTPDAVTNYTFGKNLVDDESRFSLGLQGVDILDEIQYRADALGSVGVGVGNRKGKAFRPAGENLRAGIRGQASWQGVPGNVIENMFGRRSGLDWRGSVEGEAGLAYANGAVRPYLSFMPQTNIGIGGNMSIGIGAEMRGRYDNKGSLTQKDAYSGMSRGSGRYSLKYDMGDGDFIEGYYAPSDPFFQGETLGVRNVFALESKQPRFGIRLRKSFAKGGSLDTYQTKGEVSFQSLDPRLQGNRTDATYVNTGVVNDPYILNRNQAQIIADESPQQTVSSYEKPSVVDQAINKLANPFTTAGYLARGEMMPTTVPSKDNVFDLAADIVNPVAYIDYAKQAIGDYGDGDVVGGTFNAMAAAPFIPGNLKGLFGKGSSLRKTVVSPYSAKLDKTLYAPQKVYGRGMPNMDAEMTMRGELIEQYNARNNAYHTVNITDDIRNNEYLRDRARTYGYNPDSDRDLALFLGTSPGGVGRRTGYENILPEGFDFLYSGNNPIQTFSRYSQFGDNVAPFTTKFKLFNDNASMLSDRQLFERIQALDGVNTYRPDLGIKTLKKSEDLSDMVQGQIINTNSLHVPGLNQTNIMVGRKNIPVRDPIDIRSAREMSGWPSAYELGDGRGQFKNSADYDFYFKQTGGQQGPPYMTEGPVQELVYPGRQEGPQDVLTENISRTGKLGNATKSAAPSVDVDRLRKGIKYAESLGGKLMMNPESSATGFYGQLYSEIEGKDFLQGISRQEFANDTTLQNKVFDERLAGNESLFGKKTGLVQDGLDLYNEYKPQLGDKLTYTPTEIAALTNMLGRQGTREYLGYVLRDGKSLEEALPNLYGSSAKYKNKTPDEYIQKFNEAFAEGGENIPVYNTYSSKNRAWLAARKNLGRGKKFMYGGKVYSTNTPKGL